MVRPYTPGDDVRRIDWNVTARTNEPHVRVDLAERVLVTWLVLDTSPSMQFGTADRRKADVAEGVAIAIGHLATRRGNRLGDRHVRRRGAQDAAAEAGAGRASSVCWLPFVASRTRRRRRDLARRGDHARRAPSTRQRSLVVVVSDFRGPQDWRRPLLELAGRHDVVAVEIRDPREQELSNAGCCGSSTPRRAGSFASTRAAGACASASPSPPQAERAQVARNVRLGRRAPRRAHDLGRLAAPARRLPAPEPFVTFTWPHRARRARRSSRCSSSPTSGPSGGATASRRAFGNPGSAPERGRPRAGKAALPAARHPARSRSPR